MYNVVLKFNSTFQLLLLALLAFVAIGCEGSAKFIGRSDTSDKETNNGESEDQKENQPQPVAGSNLISYGNAALDCSIIFRKDSYESFDCYAATIDKDGKIVRAIGLEEGVEIGWTIPSGNVAPSCEPSLGSITHINELKFSCEFESADNSSPPKGVNMIVKDLSADKTKTLKYRASWTNAANPFDVNNDGYETATDLLLIINFMLLNGDSTPIGEGAPPNGFVDVNGDGRIDRSDTSLVIDNLNGDQGQIRIRNEKLQLRPWTNPDEPLDVNMDGNISSQDLLMITNHLLLVGEGAIGTDSPNKKYLDVDGDLFVTKKDANLVENYLKTPR
jgi:hypothetical protein